MVSEKKLNFNAFSKMIRLKLGVWIKAKMLECRKSVFRGVGIGKLQKNIRCTCQPFMEDREEKIIFFLFKISL